MRRNAARLVAVLALIAVAVPCLLRFAQWRFDTYLRDTAAHALALSARAETPWRWRFADAEDIVAGRVFEAGNFDFANGVLTVQSDGRAFEIGLPLPIKADLRRFPQMEIVASLDVPGRLWVVAAQDIGQAATHTPGIELKPGRSIEPIALSTLPANAAMLRLRVELPNGARLHLRGVALERAASAVAADLNAPPNVAATIDDKTPDAELAAIEAGAQDFEPAENGAMLFLTDATDLDAVCRALPEYGFTVQSAQLGYRPKNTVTLNDAEREEVEAFLEALDADDDVQNIYVGLD